MDWKQALKERAAAKRAKVTLLKDASLEGLLVACDYVEQELGLAPSLWRPRDVPAYLKYASVEQVAALATRIPSEERRVWAYNDPNGRAVTCFNLAFLRALLRFLGVNPDKYVSACPTTHRRS